MTSVPEREVRFESLLREWEMLTRGKDAERLQQQREQVDLWGDRLADMEHEQVLLCEKGQWRSGPRDLLTVLRQARRETYHSAILAWLMTPTGHHGLGPRFLRGALARCSPSARIPDGSLLRAAASVEVTRSQSRADIVVRCPDHTIVVETKVDANEGYRQCRRLFDDYQGEPSPIFVFLSPDGREPKTATGPAKGRFRTLSFSAVRDELEVVIDDVRAAEPQPWGYAAAVTYLATLKTEFP